MHFSEFPRSGAGRRRNLKGFMLVLGLLAAPALGVEPDSTVFALLDAAENAERQGHLIYPASGSAMALYHEVLFLEPDNGHAREGLVRLAEQHLEAAQKALDSGQLIKADSLVSKARMIYPEYPAIETLRRQIQLMENAQRTRRTLDWRQVAERDPALDSELLRLGGVAKRGDCRVTINVSNDAEGRWIYQKMNRAAGTGRVRAEVQIASPTAVDILCFTHPPPEEETHDVEARDATL